MDIQNPIKINSQNRSNFLNSLQFKNCYMWKCFEGLLWFSPSHLSVVAITIAWGLDFYAREVSNPATCNSATWRQNSGTMQVQYWSGVRSSYCIFVIRDKIMPRIKLFQSFLLVANVSSLQRVLCMPLQSVSMLEYFLKSLSTNFTYVNVGLLCGDFKFLQASSNQSLTVL